MATYFVASGGSNTAPYETWAKAATSLATALAAATTAGDIVVIQYDAVPTVDMESSAATTYTLAANNIQLISASNGGGSAYTPTPMGTTSWIGNSTVTARFASIAGAVNALISGITFRQGGSTANGIVIGSSGDGVCYHLEDCLFWTSSTTAGTATFTLGGSFNSYVALRNCTYRFGTAVQAVLVRGGVDHFGGGISTAGTAPNTPFLIAQPLGTANFVGFDFSHVASAIFNGGGTAKSEVFLDRCKLPTGYSLLVTQSPANRSSMSVTAFDCSVGDTHGIMHFADAFGSVVSDTGIYFTAGPATQSWKIVTTANCSFATPFVTPPIFSYNSALSAITPYLEILRDGSATAYDNDEVWVEFMAKVTSGISLATLYSDRMALGGTPAAQAAGVGLGSWTGESGTAWSGKIDSGASLTPAEVGDISAQVCVGLPSATVYVDPSIRS